MTELRINIAVLSNLLREKREEWENWNDIYDSYREFLKDTLTSKAYLWQPESPRTADDFRRSVEVAARTAYLKGATDAQVNMLVRLAVQLNDFREICGGALSKGEAANLIDAMKARVARSNIA